MKVAIHASESIGWHLPFASKMSDGLKALGITHGITDSRERFRDVSILLGTSLWRAMEADGGSYLLVDRCSFGDTNEWVSLVWNGHGRRGDHKVPSDLRNRAGSLIDSGILNVEKWRPQGRRIVLCGQHETYSPRWPTTELWYAHAMQRYRPDSFRPHPAELEVTTILRCWPLFEDVDRFITLNTSFAVDAALHGCPVVVEDEGGMAYPGFERGDDRLPWLRWLAWTQWHHGEIAAGRPIAHLFEGML